MSAKSDYETVILVQDGAVATITLNRPDSLNAFNETLKTELLEVLKKVERDASVRCVLMTGAGRAFGSGQDLADLKDWYEGEEPPELGDMLRKAYIPLIRRICEMEKPFIAAVNGVAAGAGASFAFACDMRIASEKASFIQAFIHVGLIPDCGATYFLPRLVGVGKAMELCCLGEKIKADEALRLGLVNRVVPPEQLMEVTMELAQRLAALPTKALGLNKRLFQQAYKNDLEAQLEAEAFAQATAARTADHLEGVRAFNEKRKPQFNGA